MHWLLNWRPSSRPSRSISICDHSEAPGGPTSAEIRADPACGVPPPAAVTTHFQHACVSHPQWALQCGAALGWTGVEDWQGCSRVPRVQVLTERFYTAVGPDVTLSWTPQLFHQLRPCSMPKCRCPFADNTRIRHAAAGDNEIGCAPLIRNLLMDNGNLPQTLLAIETGSESSTFSTNETRRPRRGYGAGHIGSRMSVIPKRASH